MEDQYSRTRLLLGEDGIEKLRNARVILFGLGGVGGYAAEALARAGIGHIALVDSDTLGLTNLNRQLLATHSSLGLSKTAAAASRIADIDPTIQVRTYDTFYLPETASAFDFTAYDYILDAIDTVAGKLSLMEQAQRAGVPIISCMGTGNKLDATAFRVADISKTSGCPLARVIRKECAKRGIRNVKAVYSPELGVDQSEASEELERLRSQGSSRRSLPGSTSFVPGVAGLIMAGEVILDLCK